ncbi:MAG: hypothetical protein NTW52_02680 [Planctomycetota bacterium]|nr:hypothetical protein [Planctomycetota bacterium]
MRAIFLFSLVVLLGVTSPSSKASAQTKVTVDILDKVTGDRVPARVEYTQPPGRGPKPRKNLTAGRYILFDRDNLLSPGPGSYEFTVRRGPEFQDVKGGFAVERNAVDSFEVVVPHKTPMRLFGWYSGDLSCVLPPSEVQRWMAAESLDIAATTASGPTEPIGAKSAANARNKTSSIAADNDPTKSGRPLRPSSTPLNAKGEPDWTNTASPAPLTHVVSGSKQIDAPEFGGILIHHYSNSPEAVSVSNSIETEAKAATESTTYDWLRQLEKPTPDSKEGAKEDLAIHIELTRPWELHVPLLLATDNVDSIQLLSHHLKPLKALPLSPSIRNPDGLRFKGKKGLGRLSEHIYWQMLESGLRIPLTAGSGFNPVGDTTMGYNRVYVFLEQSMTPDPQAWWQQVRNGATLVTNGPLMVPSVNGMPPGSTQVGYRGQPIPLDIELDLTVRDPVEYLEVIFNGQSLYQARLEDHARRGSFPPLAISESGWLLIRVVTEHEESYRMTTTSPYYFEFENKRVSQKAVRFFQDWLHESEASIRRDPEQTKHLQSLLGTATDFWASQLKLATVE